MRGSPNETRGKRRFHPSISNPWCTLSQTLVDQLRIAHLKEPGGRQTGLLPVSRATCSQSHFGDRRSMRRQREGERVLECSTAYI